MIATENKLRVVIDTNVFISAFVFGGKPLEVIKLILKVFPRTKLALIKEKDDDNRILECALERHVAYIVTGDKKHILALKEFNGIRIVSVDEFLKIFNRDVSFR